MLDFFESMIGPYPFGDEKLGIVETPHLGMEHQTINAYGNDSRRRRATTGCCTTSSRTSGSATR